MRRFVAENVRVKAVFMDEPHALEAASAMCGGTASADGGAIVARIAGVDRTLHPTDVLFLDAGGSLHVMDKDLFLVVFTEYEAPRYSFGQAVDMVAAGRKMARKAWGDGVHLVLISPAVEMNPFIGIFDGVLKPYVPGPDTMLADDFVEVE